MELGLYSFGDLLVDPNTGTRGTTAQTQRNLLDAIRLSEEVGLDFFGIGEHQTQDMPASVASVILGAAASVTKRINLSSAVTVIVPRPERGKLPIWLGTGGHPQSSGRAAQMGLPVSYGIIGGQAARFGPLADLCRRAQETPALTPE